ncbi:DUF4238 domain-containing protein [Gordonia alkanivorans]|uniref:DUF4238 domain-containing protein n=1 Tax=Gordonia alkanivorans TaxID=84096 RepID=UPI003B00DE65
MPGRTRSTHRQSGRAHIIPRFLLRRWADRCEQVQVYSREDGRYSRRAVSDIAVRDFYTFIDLEGHSNSRLEDLLSKVEEDGSAVINTLTSRFYRPGSRLTAEQRDALDMFVAFQLVRGPRSRREMELLADYFVKSSFEGEIPDDEIAKIEISPHQNQHITSLCDRARSISQVIHPRPISIVHLDQKLLWLSDEPVVIEHDVSNNLHHPDCGLTESQLKRRMRAARRAGRDVAIVRHVRSERSQGVLDASAIAMPLAPNVALIYGANRPQRDLAVHSHTLAGRSAIRLARNLNIEVASAALDVIVGDAKDANFRDGPMPGRTPLLHICSPQSRLDHALNSTPRRLRPVRYTSDPPDADQRARDRA